jgi:CheY-like chemotaxis protein
VLANSLLDPEPVSRVSSEPFYGNWMVAVVEAAEVAGAPDVERATIDQLTKAWELVRKAAEISPIELTERIAEQSHIEVADLSEVDTHAATLIPGELARRRIVVPIRVTDREIVIATANPLSQGTKREVEHMTSRQVVFAAAPPHDIATALQSMYGHATEAEQSGPPVKLPEMVAPSGPHVLVVDDEAGQRALFRSVLEEGGFRVSVAQDGSEAVDVLLGSNGVDLVTLDYWMDKMNGLRVLQQIRATPEIAGVPVIVVTGANDRRIEMSLFEAGADDFVVKPIDGPLFILRVQAVLRRRQFA